MDYDMRTAFLKHACGCEIRYSITLSSQIRDMRHMTLKDLERARLLRWASFTMPAHPCPWHRGLTSAELVYEQDSGLRMQRYRWDRWDTTHA